MLFAGIDVGGRKKGQAVCLLDTQCRVLRLEYGISVDATLDVLHEVREELRIVGIDAPRQALDDTAPKAGRACERELVRATGLRVQWTPRRRDLVKPYNLWMVEGFALFAGIARALPRVRTLEVFPSASYGRFPREAALQLPLAMFARKARVDQLDAACCALVAWCYAKGWYESFGTEEAGGTIVIPWEASLESGKPGGEH